MSLIRTWPTPVKAPRAAIDEGRAEHRGEVDAVVSVVVEVHDDVAGRAGERVGRAPDRRSWSSPASPFMVVARGLAVDQVVAATAEDGVLAAKARQNVCRAVADDAVGAVVAGAVDCCAPRRGSGSR